MRSPYNFIIKPKGERYNNKVSVGNGELIVNTDISAHEFTNRIGVITAVPTAVETSLRVGDEVVLHHNVFRRWHNVHGIEKNSRSYISENEYAVSEDQIFAYRRWWKWKALDGFCFVKPLVSIDKLDVAPERSLIGVVKYPGENTNTGDLVGYRPGSEYEFVINNERLYRVMSKFITIKYEYQGDEEEYNPSWAKSS
jgi:hypothetical protein